MAEYQSAVTPAMLDCIAKVINAFWMTVCELDEPDENWPLRKIPGSLVETFFKEASTWVGPMPWYQYDEPGTFEEGDNIPEEVRVGVRQHNMCDVATYTTLPLVRHVLRNVDPHAEADWIRMWPKRKFMLYDRRGPVGLPGHSAIRIRLCDDTQWVIDPSGTQFGIDSNRIWRFKEYVREFVRVGWPQELHPWFQARMEYDWLWVSTGEYIQWPISRGGFLKAFTDWEARLPGQHVCWWETAPELTPEEMNNHLRDLEAIVRPVAWAAVEDAKLYYL